VRHYRCYFLNGETIRAAEDIGAKDDADALLRAEELLADSSFRSIEVWQEKRLVGRIGGSPDLTASDGDETSDSLPRPQ
jgi:hypothetical protein